MKLRECKSEFCFLNVLNSQAPQANGSVVVDKPQTPAYRCRRVGCGDHIIWEDGKSQHNFDGECQKQQPAAGTYWYAMQSQKLCQRWIWPGPQVSIKPCWCVVPKCKPAMCGTRAAPAGSKCYHERQPNMECQQSGNLCKEIEDPRNRGGEKFYYEYVYYSIHCIAYHGIDVYFDSRFFVVSLLVGLKKLKLTLAHS